MIRRMAISLVGILLIAGVTTVVYAHHSYLLSVQQLQAGLKKAPSMAQKGFVLIDVRSPEEHSAGFIPGTDLNIDFREIKTRHREIGVPQDEHIVVYCQSGHRSNIAAETVGDLGFQDWYNVRGSLNGWVGGGFPVSR